MSESREIQRRSSEALTSASRSELDRAPARRAVGGPVVAATWDQDLTQYRAVIRRRWPTAFAIFLVVVLGVSAGVVLQEPTYRAMGLLEIGRDNAGVGSVGTLFSPEAVADDDLETQYGILTSAMLAERVISQLELDMPREPTWLERWTSAILGTDRHDVTKDVVQGFRDGLIVSPRAGSRLVEVGFDSTNPELAARIVNAVLDNYLKWRLEEAERSAVWLTTQREVAKTKLEESQGALQAYVQKHGLQVLETGKGETENLVNDRLRQLHEQLALAQAARYEKQSTYELVRQPESLRELDGPVVQSLNVRLADLRRDYAKLAAVFHDDYPRLKELKNQIEELEGLLEDESRLVVSRVQRDYGAAVRREGLLKQALDQQHATAQALGVKSAGYESLKREVVTNQQLYTALDQRLKEVGISAALKATNVGIVDRAKPPLEPYSSPFAVTLSLGLMIGLLMGVGGALLQERFDTSMRTVHDVDSYLGVPALAAIPTVSLGEGRPIGTFHGSQDGPTLMSGSVPTRINERWVRRDPDGRQQTRLAEAFAALRAAVLLDQDAPPPRALMVTSAQPAEGKTTVSVNLALSLARLKHRVLLIDANMRNPCVLEALGLRAGRGLLTYLTGELPWRTCIHTEALPNLDVLGGAEPDASPAELLSLPRMQHLIAEASAEYDFVVMDSPALLVHSADVRILAALADGVLLTVRGGSTPREAVSHTLSQLGRVIGVVLNRSDVRDRPGYYGPV